MGLIDIAPGEIGAVVTYLEMTGRPKPGPLPASPLRLRVCPDITPTQYRLLFERIGGRWLWYSRLRMDDATLAASICEVHAIIDSADAKIGMVELDFTVLGECLICFLGLAPELVGQGHGSWLFAQTLALAWREGVTRVHVNTCTLDHPAALPAYMKAGFTAYKRVFETFPDPRLTDLLPRDVAPQIPIIS
jgi:GNAT superfamily N-acetyltransferase